MAQIDRTVRDGRWRVERGEQPIAQVDGEAEEVAAAVRRRVWVAQQAERRVGCERVRR